MNLIKEVFWTVVIATALILVPLQIITSPSSDVESIAELIN